MVMKRVLLRILLAILVVAGIGLLIPQNLKMPVVGADGNSYNHQTFWYEGWGTSIVHKGIDVFAKRGTSVRWLRGEWCWQLPNMAREESMCLSLAQNGKYITMPIWTKLGPNLLLL